MTKESPEPPGVAFSAFAGELLIRVYENFNDAGAFGRFAQKLIIGCLRARFPDLHENTGAGTPGAHLGLGSLDVSSQHPAQRADEARGLAECIEKVLRLGDTDLVANKAESKQRLDKCFNL